jgi:hypothetical protein
MADTAISSNLQLRPRTLDRQVCAVAKLSQRFSLLGKFIHCPAQRRIDLSSPEKYWEVTADNLSKEGWSWGCVSAINLNGRTIWIADAHRDDGKRFVVHSDEKLTAFLELERAVCIHLLTEQY